MMMMMMMMMMIMKTFFCGYGDIQGVSEKSSPLLKLFGIFLLM